MKHRVSHRLTHGHVYSKGSFLIDPRTTYNSGDCCGCFIDGPNAARQFEFSRLYSHNLKDMATPRTTGRTLASLEFEATLEDRGCNMVASYVSRNCRPGNAEPESGHTIFSQSWLFAAPKCACKIM